MLRGRRVNSGVVVADSWEPKGRKAYRGNGMVVMVCGCVGLWCLVWLVLTGWKVVVWNEDEWCL